MFGLLKQKKAQMAQQLSGAPGLIMLLVIIAIVGAIGVLIVTNVGSTFTAGSAEANITAKGTEAVTQFFSLLPTLGVIMIAIILLAGVGGLLFLGFRNR